MYLYIFLSGGNQRARVREKWGKTWSERESDKEKREREKIEGEG